MELLDSDVSGLKYNAYRLMNTMNTAKSKNKSPSRPLAR